VDLDQRAGFVERLGDRHPPAGAGHRPRRSHDVDEGSIVTWVLHVDEAEGAARRTTALRARRNRMKAYYISLFITVPDEGETEAWQVEQAIRDAAEEHLWQVVSLTRADDESGGTGG
jgi:hypothetical protein